MIVKNEEKVLARCLDSVNGIVDEIIIIDTGSTDASKDIARKYTNHVYDFTWTGSFSEARNFAQQYASGQWILALDADEYVDGDNLKETIKQLRENEVSNSPIESYSVKIINFTGSYGENIVQHYHSRIYKNNGHIKYYRDIHEQLGKTNGDKLESAISPLNIYHSGYLNSTIKAKDKNKRNTEILHVEISKSGESGYDYYNLGNEYKAVGKLEEALDAYTKAFQKKGNIAYSWVPNNIIQIINCLTQLNRFSEGLAVIADAGQLYPRSPEFICLKSNIYVLQHRYEDAKNELLYLLNNKDKYQQYLISIDSLEFIPHRLLGYIYESQEDYEAAFLQYSQALAFNQTNLEMIARMIRILLKFHNSKEITSFVKKHGWDKQSFILQTIIFVLLNNNQADFAKTFINDLSLLEDVENLRLKAELVDGHVEYVYDQLKSKSMHELETVISKKQLDLQDLILVGLQMNDTNLLEKIYQHLDNQEEKMYVNLLRGNSKNVAVKDPAYLLNLMEKAIQYKQFALFESLIPLKDYYDESINLTIGHMLYRYQFKEIAVSFYQEMGSLEKFDDQAFLNVIQEFIRENENKDALEYAIFAIDNGRDDFRLYKYAIELAIQNNQIDLKKDLVNTALIKYNDSSWLTIV
ncbi:glycosyltransferase [Caldibacillus lycopersici]|uniref:Glycosyltransferase n=2 Tax=Perspicuibacillus lycopersici TaxID=1325689 RepID=A0AAE3IR02_9BACI|nr:glycosyltransferase [Perspicuibacillus lycopersici]